MLVLWLCYQFLLMAPTFFECHGDNCPNRCEVDATRCSCPAGNKCIAHEAAYWAGCGQTWQVKGSDKFFCIECCRKNHGYEAKAASKASNHFTKWKANMVCKDIKKTCRIRSGDESSPERRPRWVPSPPSLSGSSNNSLNQVDVIELANRVEVLEKLFEARAWSEDGRIAEKVAEAMAQHLQQHDGSNSSTTFEAFNQVQMEDVDVRVMAAACQDRIDLMKQEGAAEAQQPRH